MVLQQFVQEMKESLSEIKEKDCAFKDQLSLTESSGGSKGGDTRPNFFYFHEVFRKKMGQIIGWHPNLWSWPSPLGNPESATGKTSNIIKRTEAMCLAKTAIP